MADYVTELLQDAWESAKGALSVLLHRMQDNVVDELPKMWKRYAQITAIQGHRKKFFKVVSCPKFNRGTCN